MSDPLTGIPGYVPASAPPAAAGMPRASWGYRAGATLVDISIALVPGFLAGYVLTDESSYASPVILIVWILNVIVLASLNGGRPIGKLVAGTRIVRENSGGYGLGTALLRDFLCRLLFFVPLFFLVDSLMPLGERRQSVRDRMVGTIVVQEPEYRARRWPLVLAALLAAAALGATLVAAGTFDGDYDDNDREAFVDGCTGEGGSRSECECAWDEISSELSYDEYFVADRQDPEDWDPEVAQVIDGAFARCTG